MHDKLTALLKILNEDKNYAKHADVARLFTALAASVKESGAALDTKLAAAVKDFAAKLDESEGRVGKAVSESSASSSSDAAAIRAEATRIQEQITWLRSAVEGLPDILSEEYISGMLESFRATIVYPDAPTPTAEIVRDLLETLTDEERLDASAIKNLPEATQKIVERFYGHTSLMTLADVELAGIVPGQSITWDGIKWVPYTPAGGGGTPVWGEDLTPQGPGTDFTLDHTPIAGTVRLFRGGAYQSASQGDYSITGADITLSPALADGEILLVDYSFN